MSQLDLFGDLNRPDKSADIAIAKKSKKTAKKAPATVKGSGLSAKIALARQSLEEHLGKYKDEYICIRDIDTLHDYVSKCIESGILAIDTETTGLNLFRDTIVGISLYSPNVNPAYIPINHISYITHEHLPEQLTCEQIKPELERLATIPEIDMFNASFDRRVIKHGIGIDFPCTWDAKLAAKIMNENEDATKLKPLHEKYVLKGVEKELSFSDYFDEGMFNLVPIDMATLYAAHDAIVTREYVEFQQKYVYYEEDKPFDERNGMNGASWTFFNIEMPCVDATIELEENGVCLDLDYAHELSVKYHKMEDDILREFYEELDKYSADIESYRLNNSNVKLDNPINVRSPKQLSILFYDIMKLPSVDKKSPRGTGEDIIQKILAQKDVKLLEILLRYRSVDKLIGTYIDKLPNCLEHDGRIHGGFNQYGAKTGRYSSNNPNLQNIPSHNKDIRPMFVASEGYLLMSSDFSQQEPKSLAALCRKDGDSQMYDTFMEGKDLYSEIASKAFNVPYEDCLEFNPDGSKNKEGKARRTQAKSILLGVLYGRGEASIAEQLGCTLDKAKAIKASVFKGFPAIKKFEQESKDFAFENGYVTTVCGRKRRLFDLFLDDYEFKWIDAPKTDDVLDFDGEIDTDVPDEICNKYLRKLSRVSFKDKRKVFEEANKKDGIWIIDNTVKIADAEREIVNSRIQGSAADLTKLAMIKLHNSKELKDLGFRMLIQIHDEIIGESPKENIEECSQLMSQLMSEAAEDILGMPIKCDVEITKAWYGESIDGKERKVGESNTAREFENELAKSDT